MQCKINGLQEKEASKDLSAGPVYVLRRRQPISAFSSTSSKFPFFREAAAIKREMKTEVLYGDSFIDYWLLLGLRCLYRVP